MQLPCTWAGAGLYVLFMVLLFFIWECVSIHMHGTHIEVRGQLKRVGSLLLFMQVQGSNLDCVGLGGKHLYPLSYLSSPGLCILRTPLG